MHIDDAYIKYRMQNLEQMQLRADGGCDVAGMGSVCVVCVCARALM